MNYSITGLLYDILFIVVLMLAASSGWRRGFVSSLMLLIGGVAGIFGAGVRFPAHRRSRHLQ